MSNLRIIGLVVGIMGLFFTFKIYRGPRWSRSNFILSGLLSFSLVSISINPNLLNIITEMLRLQRQQRGRIITLLIASNVVVWFFVLYLKSKLDEYRYQFDLLVRNLGYENISFNGNSKINILVIIPAHNEADNLEEILNRLPSVIYGRNLKVIVVDDGSTDNTSKLVKNKRQLVVHNKTRRGGGAALRLGYDVAKKAGAEIIVTMDADGQHHPEQIERLIEPIINDRYDFVIGSRILGTREVDNKLRYFGLNTFNFFITFLLGEKITDCSSGFRAFKSNLLDRVTLQEDQYHTSELIIDAIKKGFRIGEVPITISKRKSGLSKKGKDWKYGFSFAKAIVKTWWR